MFQAALQSLQIQLGEKGDDDVTVFPPPPMPSFSGSNLNLPVCVGKVHNQSSLLSPFGATLRTHQANRTRKRWRHTYVTGDVKRNRCMPGTMYLYSYTVYLWQKRSRSLPVRSLGYRYKGALLHVYSTDDRRAPLPEMMSRTFPHGLPGPHCLWSPPFPCQRPASKPFEEYILQIDRGKVGVDNFAWGDQRYIYIHYSYVQTVTAPWAR